MRFLIINSDYSEVVTWLYSRTPGLQTRSYDEQMRARNESLFGVADFYPTNLRRLGHEAFEVHANNLWMQRAWAREHGLRLASRWRWPVQLSHRMPFLAFFSGGDTDAELLSILAAQIKHHSPDVLLDHIGFLSSDFLKEYKPLVRLLIGQIASPLPANHDFGCYDLILSSLPNLVAHFRNLGLSAEFYRLGFEPTVLQRLRRHADLVPLSFAGSLSPAHKARLDLLNYLCDRTELEVWGNRDDSLAISSSLSQRYRGPVWGIDMYQLLHNSRMTLNRHIDMAGDYANNMRLYEATGVGTLLVTEWKINLPEIFEPGREVVTYRTREECVEVLQYYRAHEDERAAIAAAGQQRTLRNHTYFQRMQELIEIVERYL
jgi:spore maturation protein CgeB